MPIHRAVSWPIAVIGLFTMGSVPGCYATITSFTDRPSWTAASSNITTIDFNNLTAQAGFPFSSTLTTGGVTFASFFNGFASNDIVIKNNENWGTGNYLLGPHQDSAGNYTFKITFPGSVTSFGTDIMYSGSYESTLLVTLSAGGNLTTTTTLPNHTGPAFFGFTTDTAISYVAFKPTYISGTENRLIIDNVSFGDAGGGQPPITEETPETSTILLCAAGLLLIRALRRPSPGITVLRTE